MRWNYLSIPKLQRLHRWSLGVDKWFHLTRIIMGVVNYLSMLGLKLIHVSRKGHWWRGIEAVFNMVFVWFIWKHIFARRDGYKNGGKQRKITEIPGFEITDHVETIYAKKQLWNNVVYWTACPCLTQLITWKMVTSVIFYCSKQILYPALVVKYVVLLSTTRVTCIIIDFVQKEHDVMAHKWQTTWEMK